MTTIYLVRHPATPWSGLRYAGRTDVPLSVAGLRAVSLIAARLADRAPAASRVVASPLRRAAEPAREIAAAGGWPLAIDERWREVDFGAIEGVTFGDLARDWPALAARLVRGERAIDWPAGESWAAFRDRVAAAWAALLQIPEHTTIVVAHGGPIELALELTLGHRRQLRRVAPGEVLEVVLSRPPRLVGGWRPGR
ncbi:MAG: histidine phosphatase family protein [Anaerolinea sp.]|nr:histidine phosphatase family protein [Anaerolinea sp.]